MKSRYNTMFSCKLPNSIYKQGWTKWKGFTGQICVLYRLWVN